MPKRPRKTTKKKVGKIDRLLSGVPLFNGVRLARLAKDLERGQVTVLKKGDVLLTPQEPNSELYILLDGVLAVQIDLQMQPIAVLRPGECVGELSVFEGELPSAYVIATADSRVYRVHKEVVWRLIDDSNRFAQNLLHVLGSRIRSGNEALTSTQERLLMQEISASLDPLTGIYNRRWLNNMFRRSIERARISQTPVFLLMIDIDHFKAYNDAHGHLAGDQCLRAVAATLRDSIRPNDLLARFGGEEFSVLLSGTGPVGSITAAERLRKAVENRSIRNRDGTPLPSVTISVGVAQLGPDESLESLIEKADKGLYEAKEQGRNQVVVREARVTR
ncbi:MAG: GGDEF domain-containing protein [Gammaproteobacteria bacterium]|nr:GGDEF domain-containing protein [Gammaproteobacteria bacterium]